MYKYLFTVDLSLFSGKDEFINIYLALKTSRNNAVVDLSESKTIEKRVIKESIFNDTVFIPSTVHVQ